MWSRMGYVLRAVWGFIVLPLKAMKFFKKFDGVEVYECKSEDEYVDKVNAALRGD